MHDSDGRVVSREAPHRDGKGKFFNPWPGAAPHGFGDFLKWVAERRAHPRLPDPPPSAFPRATPRYPSPHAAPGSIVVTWIGHSSFLVQMGGMNLLFDPVWSRRASPVKFAGPERHLPPGVALDALPPIDAVLISHDHYDHLDAATVKRIGELHPNAQWLAPLGVGDWLERRGVSVAAEMDWWERVKIDSLEITCTPAQHFSGRRLTNRDSTLWCGWAVRAGDRAIFYAGDTGRHPEFGSIARELGPFDVVFLPIGAYDPRWFMGPVHMAPEQAVAAYHEIATAQPNHDFAFVAMHWGTFRLTDEPLDEPPRLLRAAWRDAALDDARLWIAAVGETAEFGRGAGALANQGDRRHDHVEIVVDAHARDSLDRRLLR